MKDQLSHIVHDPSVRVLGDVSSIGVVSATLVGFLPAVAATFTIIWTAIRIYETETVQRLIHGKRDEGNDD